MPSPSILVMMFGLTLLALLFTISTLLLGDSASLAISQRQLFSLFLYLCSVIICNTMLVIFLVLSFLFCFGLLGESWLSITTTSIHS